MRNLIAGFILVTCCSAVAWAVPDTTALIVADVTPSSFAVVWTTDVPAYPTVEVYADQSMTTTINSDVVITPMPDASAEVAEAARNKGIMKVRVAGLLPGTTYYVRTVTADPVDPLSVGYSALRHVTTAVASVPYIVAPDGALGGLNNDILSFPVHVRPSDRDQNGRMGDLAIIEIPGSPYPLSSFVGAGGVNSEALLDLNNVYGENGRSLPVNGGEKGLIKVYRGAALETLRHYRKVAANSQSVEVQEPVRGFFADINMDSRVDMADFEEFRAHFRTAPDDSAYNPDFNFAVDAESRIDALDFARFAREYGKTDVQ